mmetsp:Transcript_14741/g.49002  ORF Transcript_14741/g.49002 Transcript_14741/m.49002 type:complete len:245 (-) Transcript_14741:220-954(-)
MPAAPPSHSRIADAARSAAAGSVAGASVSAVLQPFDTLRTRLQADATTGTARPVGATLRAIAAEGHGVSSLWRGSTATVLRVGGGAGLHFFSLQLLRGAAAGGSGQRPQWVGDAAMGGTARAVAVFAMCPLTTVKTRMEASGAAASRFSYASVPEALASISRREGVRALWRGVLPALGANAPFSAVHYACYSRLQAEIARRRPASSPSSPATNFAAGGVASALATLALPSPSTRCQRGGGDTVR